MNRITEIANHADVSEKAIESYLVKKVEQAGGLALKYTNQIGRASCRERV